MTEHNKRNIYDGVWLRMIRNIRTSAKSGYPYSCNRRLGR